MENYHLSIHMAFWKESMINRLSNLINRNRSAAKISQVLCSNTHTKIAMASSVLNLVHGERCIVWFHHSIWDLEVQMWKQSQSYFVPILTDLDVLTTLPPNRQMHAAPPLQNVNWFLVWGKLLCYENNLKPKDLVLCVPRKSVKQEQIGGNWSTTLFLYPYTVYSSSALEIP